MSTEMSYKDRLLLIEEWMGEIIEGIKKDIKNEHLKKDYNFCKKYFPGKNFNKLEVQEMTNAYKRALREEEAAEAIAEFIVQHWILRNSEIYNFFEEQLSKINPDFTAIQELTLEQAEGLQKASFHEFGKARTYIFAQLNGVAFSQETLKKMTADASKEKEELEKKAVVEKEIQSLEEMKVNHAQEMARLKDKYEKKLIGFHKKYSQDVGLLKKQLANLQRKLTGVSL